MIRWWFSNPAQRALRMALAMRDRVNELKVSWLRHGYELSLGVGMAQGFATIGAIGFEGWKSTMEPWAR